MSTFALKDFFKLMGTKELNIPEIYSFDFCLTLYCSIKGSIYLIVDHEQEINAVSLKVM